MWLRAVLESVLVVADERSDLLGERELLILRLLLLKLTLQS